jgi:hypothetical protein
MEISAASSSMLRSSIYDACSGVAILSAKKLTLAAAQGRDYAYALSKKVVLLTSGFVRGSFVVETMICLAALLSAASGSETYREWVAEPGVAAPSPSVGQRLTPPELAELANGRPTMPFGDLTRGYRGPDGALWVGSHRGLMLLGPGATRWRLFHSRRWLPSDEVSDISIVNNDEVIVDTREGRGKIARREMTLERKMAAIDNTLCKYHVLNGIVGGIHLNERGRLDAGYSQHSNDNDGLWTSIYVAAEAFRYAATGDKAAKANARRSLEALMFLERVTGISGFAARSVIPTEGNPAVPYSGEWHRSADGRWWWKGDTSSDEVDGHYFAYSIYHDVAATPEERKEISKYVERITDHILDHGLNYVGPPGVPTRWGVWAPEKLNHDLRWVGDRGLNSLEILSFLKVAEHIVGKPRYAATSKELIEKHAYETNTVFQKHAWPVNRVNHSDDELAFLAYYPLLIHERDEHLRDVYLASLKRTWFAERPERSPLFNLIYGASLQANTWPDATKRPEQAMVEPGEYDHDACIEWFRDVTGDTISWTIHNSGRADLGPLSTNRFGRLTSQVALPVSERHVMRWNGDPYSLDGGSDGRHRDDGAAILLPYWMGRYHRLID